MQLPRLYLAWHTPQVFAPGDAAMDIAASLLAGGKNARLYRRLVYDLQIAQDVNAFQQSQGLGSVFLIIATARPGHTLEKIQAVIDEELDKLRAAPADDREMTRTLNQIEANFYRGMERVGGFGGKADQLNAYYTRTGMPDYFEEDLSRYRALERRRHPRGHRAVLCPRTSASSCLSCRRQAKNVDAPSGSGSPLSCRRPASAAAPGAAQKPDRSAPPKPVGSRLR